MTEATRVDQEPFPELEAIPLASPTSNTLTTRTSSLFPVPNWAIRLFSTFPLHTWPATKVISPPPTPPATKPTLYVAPHLNRDGTFSEKGWSSSDPICLGWQIELLFRGVDFQVELIQPTQNWGPGKSLPFLHLPPSYHQTKPTRSKSWIGTTQTAAVPLLLATSSLSHFVETHFPLTRIELGETAIWKDKLTQLESKSWENLVRGRIMAGVLLAVLFSPQSTKTLQQQQTNQSFLSSLLASQLKTNFVDDQLRRISSLNPSNRADQVTSRLPGWEVGLLGWMGASSNPLTLAELQDNEFGGAEASVDEERVIREAVEAIQALGTRVEEELQTDQPTSTFLLGATRPTQLDALAFAVIHTVMSLSATPDSSQHPNEPLQRLKIAIESKPWLIKWSRSIWKTFVKEKEGSK